MSTLIELGAPNTAEFRDTYPHQEHVADRLRRTAIPCGGLLGDAVTVVAILGEDVVFFEHDQMLPLYFNRLGDAEAPTAPSGWEPDRSSASPAQLQELKRFWHGVGARSWNPTIGRIDFAATTHHSTSTVTDAPTTREVPETRPLLDVIDELIAGVPESDWDSVPTDLARNLDHYLYGAPKEDE